MPWENTLQVETRVLKSELRSQLEDLYSLGVLMLSSVYTEGYVASEVYAEALVPSEHGAAIIASNPQLRESIPPADVVLALLGYFYHHESLLAPDLCDIQAAISQYSTDLLSNKIRLPYRFGRILYDKFNDAHRGDRTHHIDESEVAALLEDTEQGVYQMGNLVTGPFGVLRSSEQRFLPPMLKLPLWHCSDTGCSALHNVGLQPANISIVRAYREIERAASDSYGPESEWRQVFSRLHRRNAWPNGRQYNDLAALIGDAVIGQERTALLTAALKSTEGAVIREALSQSPRKRRDAEGSAESLAAAQTEATQMQLLLLLKDNMLIRLLDSLVADDVIRVPSNEVRRAKVASPKVSTLDSFTEISLYGVRANTKTPLVALAALVWNAYQENGLLDDLAWRCDRVSEIASAGMVLRYMRGHSPDDVVRALVLPSRPIVAFIAEKLALRLVAGEPDEQFIKRTLWKTGFTVARYDGELARFRSRLDSFNDTLLRTVTIRSEDDREVIRSAGVNLFVSVEHLLEELLSYNVWLLSSDHFLQTRFRYSRGEAVARVSEVLGGTTSNGEYSGGWNASGGNTLGVLMTYLSASISWMSSLVSTDKEEIKRPKADFPHYADDPRRRFPFNHTALWADATSSGLKKYVEGFEGIVQQLEKSSLAAVRNGLDHKREPERFPSLDTMLICCARLREAFSLADLQRYLPKSYWLSQKTTDQYDRVNLELLDAYNHPLMLHEPSALVGIRTASFHRASIVAPGNLLDEPNSEILFELNEESVYSVYWSGYPRRRFIGEEASSNISEQKVDLSSKVSVVV